MNYYAELAVVTENTCPADGSECDGSPGDALWFNRILSDLNSYTFTVLNPVYHGYVLGFKVIQQIIPLRKSTIQVGQKGYYSLYSLMGLFKAKCLYQGNVGMVQKEFQTVFCLSSSLLVNAVCACYYTLQMSL